MNAVVIEHVKVAELPEAWRSKIAKPGDACVTVRIEEELPAQAKNAPAIVDDLLFGMWRDRKDMADVEGYIHELRSPRYKRDGSRNDHQSTD